MHPSRPTSTPTDLPATEPRTLVDILRRRAERDGARPAYRFLVDGEVDGPVETADYATLDLQVRAVAARLQAEGLAGERALLLYPPGIAYAVAFFACLYAGVVAVPAYPPDPARMERTLPRLAAIARDAGARVVLTLSGIEALAASVSGSAPELAALGWIATDTIAPGEAAGWADPGVAADAVAFLQYTSGSTGSPRGVMVTHRNLMHNAAQISGGFDVGEGDVGVTWLPPYHDMGLIGGLLQPVFIGGFTVLLSPLAFLLRPARWLEAVSRHGATVSGGPSFAFELCVRKVTDAEKARLDLSRWRVAFDGAEPVRADTLDRFARAFGPAGFRRDAFYPCYGLAEATLFVTGGRAGAPPVVGTFDDVALGRSRVAPSAAGRRLVACGHPWQGQEIRIVDPATRAPAPPDAVGEIWVRGESVARGYWNRAEETADTFGAQLLTRGASSAFLRTGDLGFLHEGLLYVTGRLKELVVVRGRNVWPHDVERTVEESHPAVRPGGVAAFAVDTPEGEGLAVVAEVRRDGGPPEPIVEAIRRRVVEAHGIAPVTVALAPSHAVPKTSSGKTRRLACRDALAEGSLSVVHRDDTAAARPAAPAGLAMSLLFFSSDAEAEGDVYGLFLDAVRAADRLGFEAVWIPERHFHPFGGLYPSPSVLAAAAAMCTDRVRLRAGSVVLPLHDPLRVAEEWAVVDRLSGGRVDIAFATGWNPNDFVLAPDRFEDRKAVTFAAVETVRRLWRGEAIPRRNGAGVEVPVRVHPRPAQAEIPLWLTCSGGDERFVDAGERGFHVLTALLFQTPEALAAKIARYREARARAGLDPAAGRVTLMLHAFVGDDPEAVHEAVRGPLEAYLASSVDLWRQGSAPLDALGPEERQAVLAYAAERYCRQSALIGTPEHCVAMLDRVRAAGVDEVACLVDFGVDRSAVLSGLDALAALRTARGSKPPPTPPRASPRRGGAALVTLVRAEVEAVLGAFPPGAGADTPLASLGLDSLTAVEIGQRIAARLGRPQPVALLFDHPTLSALADHLARIEDDASDASAGVSEVDLAAEAALPSDVTAAGKPVGFTALPRRVLLTGATGFLGAFLLRELLDRTEADVLCLVRAPTEAAGAKRIREGLVELDLWDDAFRHRVIPVLGDLAAPGLGLAPGALDTLAASLDAILHNGARVNFAARYADCRAANVGGTLEVLRLACRGPRLVPVHHVSTMAVFSQAHAGTVVSPRDEPADTTRLDTGYAESKWVADRMAREARARGLPVTIYRPGLVTGSTRTGACHLTNFVWNLIRVSVEIGALPDYDRVLDMTPVDWAAGAVVRSLLEEGQLGAVLHLVSPRPLSIAALGRWLLASGYDVRTEPFERWQIRVMQRVAATPSLHALLPILSLAAADFYEHRQVRFDAPEAALPFEALGFPCPPVDDALLDTYGAWFVARGFLPSPGARALPGAPARADEALDAGRLRELVVQITGLSGPGDAATREPLEVLVSDMRRHVNLRPGGAERAVTRLVDALIRRARIDDLLRRHPEIAKIPTPRPVIIVAPPRTGTTLLHNLLAEDPEARAFSLWEMMGPVTPPRAGAGWEQHMIGVAGAFLDETYARSPALRAIHPMSPTAPDECHWLLQCNVTSLVHAVTAHVPGYVDYLLRADMRGAYAFYRRAQQALLWRRPGGRIVAKDPWHLFHLDALLATFPDATVVLLHRDMTEVVPSFASLIHAVQSVEGHPPDARTLGRYGLDLLDAGIARMLRVRETAAPGTFVDIAYRRLVEDPLGAVRAVYRASGRTLSADAEARMEGWLARNPQGKDGRHRYGLADFELDAGEVNERFASYTARFLRG